MEFCPANESLIKPWNKNGLDRCFTSTLSSVLLTLFIPLFIAQIVYLRRSGRRITSDLQTISRLWLFQYIACLLVPCIIIIHLIVFASYTRIQSGQIYGYYILEGIAMVIAWIFSVILLSFECTRFVSIPRHKRHGVLLLFFWATAFIVAFLPLASVRSSDWWWKLRGSSDTAELVLWILLTFTVTVVCVFGIIAPGLPNDYYAIYNQLQANSDGTHQTQAESPWPQRIRRFKILYPYIWPHNNHGIKARVLFCVFLLILGRIVNVFSPIFYKQVVDSLTIPANHTIPVNGSHVDYYQSLNHREGLLHEFFERLIGQNGLAYRWDFVLEFIGIRLLQGLGGFGDGLLSSLRAQLWIPVDQYSVRELSVMLFSHLHGLSLQWHLSRKTGEMLRIMDRGTASISNVLSYMVYNIMPTIADIGVGVVYFVAVFNVWYGLLVFITMVIYVGLTIGITEWRTKFRRDMNTLDNQKSTKAVDALLNFETVKYFCMEKFERNRFREAFVKYQQAEWWTLSTLNVLNIVQTLVIIAGMLIGTLLCARDVVLGNLTVGDFVLFNTYILQLYAPLNLFGTYYRLLQTSMIDMENMFDLLEQNPDVNDLPGAPDLYVRGGELEFCNVSFHYSPDRPILKNISFRVPPGRSVALVGQSGAGKSTIVRLLFRFYDVTEGSICMDGQDISHVTQSSLRSAIGVVPQDTVLFNDSIYYNIKYGRENATDEDVTQAALSADIHQRIIEFPQQYETVVGERGLKLSGGEKQRVAIARNMLKNPTVLLLDEATSALDTATERNIQASLSRIAQNRTSVVVAHRLSTIVHVDEILMMHQGEIVERGTHAQLLAIPNGRYAELWYAQIEAHQIQPASEVEAPSDVAQ